MPPDNPLSKRDKMLYQVNTAIGQIEKMTPARRKPAPLPLHFTPHYPRAILGAVKIECWCGQDEFRSMGMDSHEFARFVSWANDHCGCQPKETA